MAGVTVLLQVEDLLMLGMELVGRVVVKCEGLSFVWACSFCRAGVHALVCYVDLVSVCVFQGFSVVVRPAWAVQSEALLGCQCALLLCHSRGGCEV